jgi:hypothetical protein
LRGHRVVLEWHAVPSYSARLIGVLIGYASFATARRRGRRRTAAASTR